MSPQYLSPGVYVEEVERGARPIEGVGTAVAAFVGFTERGPVNQPTLIANWTQFVTTFGGFLPGGFLAYSVYGYFHNGGGSCYVTRIPGGEGAAAPGSVQVGLPAKGQPSLQSLVITALEPATKPSEIEVQVKKPEDAPEDQFTLFIRKGGTEETFENVTKARAAISQAGTVAEQAQAQNMLTGALKSLFAVAENYPELKANQNFLALQEELTGTEGKIAYARQYYNDTVMSFNALQQTFPTNVIAGMFGFKPRDYFRVEEAAAREPVKVSFAKS